MAKYLLKTNLGYHCGRNYDKVYEHKESVTGWHTNQTTEYNKIVWGDRENAKEFYSRNGKTVLEKLDKLINLGFEEIEYITFEKQ